MAAPLFQQLEQLMTEEDLAPRPPQPKNWEEVEAITGGLRGVPIELIAKGRKDWEYHFKELRPCGRLSCETKHGWGMLLAIPGGRFVNIGHECASLYAKEAMTSINRVYKAQRKQDAWNAALANMREEARTMRDWLDELNPEIERLTSLRNSFLSQARGPLATNIEWRAERRKTAVEVEVRLSEEERSAKIAMLLGGRVDKTETDVHVPHFDTRKVGDLVGLNIFRPMYDPRSLAVRLRALINAILVETADEIASAESVKSTQKAMREFGGFSRAVSESIEAGNAFFGPDNIGLLMQMPLTKRQGVKQIDVGECTVTITRADHWSRAA